MIIASIFTLSSCLKDGDATPQSNLPIVGIFNYYPKETGIHLRINGSGVSQSNGAYRGGTFFYAIPGNKKIEIFDRTAPSTAMIDTTLTFKDSVNYSGYVFGTAAKPAFVRVVDEAVENLGTKSAYRFIHLGANTGKVTLKVGDLDIEAFKNRNMETPATLSKSQVFTAGNSGKFEVTAVDEAGNTLAKTESVNFEAGKHYNFVLFGTKGNNDFPLTISTVNYN